MDPSNKKPKGMLGAFKNDDGSFKKWAIALLIIGLVFFAKDIASLTTGYTDPEYTKEMEMIGKELQGFGHNLLDENAVFDDYTIPEYTYKYPGSSIMHEFLAGINKSQQTAEKDMNNIKERSLDEIDMIELNNPTVVKEVQSAYKQESIIMKESFIREKQILDELIEKITEEHNKNPDDAFVEGLYKGITGSAENNIKFAEELLVGMDDLYAKIDNYLEFLLNNQGNYEYLETGEIWVSETVEAEYDDIIGKLDEAGMDFEEISTDYMESFSGKLQNLEKSMGE